MAETTGKAWGWIIGIGAAVAVIYVFAKSSKSGLKAALSSILKKGSSAVSSVLQPTTAVNSQQPIAGGYVGENDQADSIGLTPATSAACTGCGGTGGGTNSTGVPMSGTDTEASPPSIPTPSPAPSGLKVATLAPVSSVGVVAGTTKGKELF